MPEQPCTICGDPEPHHVHHEGRRIEDYFLIGRGQTADEAARSWQAKYRAALAPASGTDVDLSLVCKQLAADRDERAAFARLMEAQRDAALDEAERLRAKGLDDFTVLVVEASPPDGDRADALVPRCTCSGPTRYGHSVGCASNQQREPS